MRCVARTCRCLCEVPSIAVVIAPGQQAICAELVFDGKLEVEAIASKPA